MTDEEKQLRIQQIEAELARRNQVESSGNEMEMGTILPIYKKPGQSGLDALLSGQFSSDAGLVGDVKRAVTLPYDVYRGNVQMTDPATGRTSEQAIRRSTEAAGVLTPTERGVGAARKMRTRAKTPTQEELFDAASRARRKAEDTGASLPMEVARKIPDYIMYKSGRGVAAVDDVNSPKTMRILNDIKTGQGDYWTLQDITNTRRKLWNVWLGDKDGTDGRAARASIDALDEIVERAGRRARELKQRGMTNQLRTGREPAGSSDLAWDDAARLSKEANEDFAAGYRSKELNKMEDATQQGAERANSGSNIGNSYRQKASSALLSDKRLSGYNKQERQALRDLVAGTPGMNRSRKWANRLSGGGGWGQTTTAGMGGAIGEAVGQSVGLPTGYGAALGAGGVFATGSGLKSLENRLTRKAFEGVDDLVRQRSNLYRKNVAKAGAEPVGGRQAQAAVKALVAAGAGDVADVPKTEIDSTLRLMTGRNTKLRTAIGKALEGGDFERAILLANVAERKKEIAPGSTYVMMRKLNLIE